VSSLDAFDAFKTAPLIVHDCADSSQRPSSGVPSAKVTDMSTTWAPDMLTLVHPYSSAEVMLRLALRPTLVVVLTA